MRVRYFKVVVVLCVFWGVSSRAQQSSTIGPVDQTEMIQAQGDWNTASDSVARVGHNWNVDALRFKDDQIRGRIAVSGSALFDSANVEGQFSGRGVFGKLVDDEGKELANFEGTVTSAGASGTYRDRNGDVGEWRWEGQLKQSQP